MLTVEKIINLLKEDNNFIEEKCSPDREIAFISYDSRKVKKDTLFFCKGQNYKEEYLRQAIADGACLYVSETKYEATADYIIVSDIQKAMAVIAAAFYGYAFRDLETVGITGTKGKTTVSCFIENILDEHMGKKTALISTINTYTGITDEMSLLTTPEAVDLQRLFYEAKESGCKYLTMEVSSQGYKKDRVYGVLFKTGIFLNIGEDHISKLEHPDFADYLNCKKQLVKNSNRVILNKNTDYYDDIYAACSDKEVITYGTDAGADYYYDNVSKLATGFSFDAVKSDGSYRHGFEIHIPGRFNIENALAAIVLGKSLGVSDENIYNGLIMTVVKGRMNVFEKDGITVIVDYAHNKLSYSKLYESLKLDYAGRRIVSVGGCVGGKAFNRRHEFGEIVGGNSDYIYLTAVDPQYEDINHICEDIATYIPSDTGYEIIPDRKTAITKAIGEAKKGDVVVLVGKGEEEYQKINGVSVKYESDLAIARQLMS